MSDDTSLFLDKIDGTNGSFVKLETNLKEGDSVEDVKNELLKTLAVFGEKNVIDTSYSEIDY